MGAEVILYLAIAFGFYMAWSIGANDAANAMGTSVGSKAITFKEAVIIAVVFEFAGAFIAGSSVTDTMRRGIVDPMLFNDPAVVGTSEGATIFMLGMLAALVSAAIWIHIAAVLGWPVSTTHSIVGAITGFGLVSVGASHIQWGTLLKIVSSWAVSPLTGGIIAFLIFTIIRKWIFNAPDPIRAVKRWSPVLIFPVFFVLALVIFYKGLPGIDLDSYGIGTAQIMAISGGFSLVGAALSGLLVRRIKDSSEEDDHHAHVSKVEGVFRYLQIATACFVAFAHGSNDVANAIGPLAAIVATFETGQIAAQVGVPTWVLLLGGVGIAVGLATYGYKVIETIGTKITDITPSRGFAAEFGAASTILAGSQLGMPISTTHTIVGAVIGVGFARGMNSLNLKVVWSILKSWVLTIPAAAGLTIGFYMLFKFLWNLFISPI
jgi:inorganic phosphate transporter, PiT family